MSANDRELLGQFTREQSQDAFTALVNRHLNLVYSAALRQVRSPQLAEEVSQTVFSQLARRAASLNPDTILTAWLYQVTRRAAIDVVRREARRQAREQIAFQMSDLNVSSAEWAQVEPLLDEAMESLEDADRTAILLRYFENKSFREVGEAIGASEDAAQKRVSRALDRLRGHFAERKVAIGAGALALAISANAVQAAPAGLGAALVAGAGLGASALSASTTVTVAKTIAMTTIQKTVVAVIVAGVVGTAVYQTHRVSTLSEQVQMLKQKEAEQIELSQRAQALQREHDRATNALAALSASENVAKTPTEVLKLRGEVGRLRFENAQIGSTNALSKVTADPAARKLLRDQQKRGMGLIYKELTQRLKLTAEQTEKFNELLADNVMESVGLVTTTLRDKPAADQMESMFAAQDKAMLAQVESLLGPDGLTQYQDYSRNLVSTLTADQYKGMMSGTSDEKALKSQQLAQVIQEASHAVLAEAGLPADYQAVPILNFRNMASEQLGERSLKLLDDIYQRAVAKASSFLTPEDLTKFEEFRKAALDNSRAALNVNRTIMAPIAN